MKNFLSQYVINFYQKSVNSQDFINNFESFLDYTYKND